MFKGELDGQSYLRYLEQQLSIFSALEKHPLPHECLRRVPRLEEDIAELVGKGCATMGELEPTSAYASYLSTLDAAGRLPHIYLHYLAVMYGGQMMKRKVPSKGAFYDFEDFQEGIASIREVQSDDWVDEVNRAYDSVIDIFDALEAACFADKTRNDHA